MADRKWHDARQRTPPHGRQVLVYFAGSEIPFRIARHWRHRDQNVPGWDVEPTYSDDDIDPYRPSAWQHIMRPPKVLDTSRAS